MKRLGLLLIIFLVLARPAGAAYIDLPIAQIASYNNTVGHVMGDSHIGAFPTANYTVLFTLNYAGLTTVPSGGKITGAILVTGTPLSINNPSYLADGSAYMNITNGPEAVTTATLSNPPQFVSDLGVWHMLFLEPSANSGLSADIITYAQSHNSTFYGGISNSGLQLDPRTTFMRVYYSDPGKTPLSGDATSDGKVNESDYAVWLTNYNKNVINAENGGDFDADVAVNGVDYAIWLKSYSP